MNKVFLLILLALFLFLLVSLVKKDSSFSTYFVKSVEFEAKEVLEIKDVECEGNRVKIKLKNNGKVNLGKEFLLRIKTALFDFYHGVELKDDLIQGKEDSIEVNLAQKINYIEFIEINCRTICSFRAIKEGIYCE